MYRNKKAIFIADLDSKNTSLIGGYCQILNRDLIESWVFVKDINSSDVIVIGSDSNYKIPADNTRPLLAIGPDKNKDFKYSIVTPFSVPQIKSTLNKISDDFTEAQRAGETIPKEKRKKFMASIISLFHQGKQDKNPENTQLSEDLTPTEETNRPTSVTEKLLNLSNPNKSKYLKVVFLGSPGSGKTTAIIAAHSKHLSTSEVTATDSVSLVKAETTIGIDYCLCTFNSGVNLKIFGTPGQDRYSYLQKQTIKGADIHVILIDASRNEPINDFLHFKKIIDESGKTNNAILVIGFTHAEMNTKEVEMMSHIIQKKFKGTILTRTIDARSRENVRTFLEEMAEIKIEIKKKEQIPEAV